MKKETADKAAKWWADQLKGISKLDNGDNTFNGARTIGLASTLQNTEKSKHTPELIDKFEKELSEVIFNQKSFYSIGVDYNPDTLLETAAEKSGIELGMTTLPWKTVMWIRDDVVSVACGYSASPEVL